MGLAIAAFRSADDGVSEIDERLAWLADQFRRIEHANEQVRRELDELDQNASQMPPREAAAQLDDLTQQAKELERMTVDLSDESDRLQRKRLELAGDEGAPIDWWTLLRDIGLIVASIAGLWAMFSGGDADERS